MSYMVIGASVFILISLALAWLATAVRIMQVPALKAYFPSSENIVKSHIDYLLMALLLIAFYLLGKQMGVVYPSWAIWAMLIGGVVNPYAFLILARHEPEDFKPGPIFSIGSTASFVLTTLGFGVAAVMVL